MKTIKKISALIIILAGILLNSSTVSSQCINTVGGLTVPFRSEVQAPTGNYLCITNGGSTCSPITSGTQTLLGMGVNNNTNINYMLDIFCDPSVPTNMDVNISSATYTVTPIPANSAGYRIGGKQMLFTQGDNQSIFVGGGQTAPAAAYNPATFGNNVFVGFQTYNNLINGAFNTVVGCQTGYSLIDGARNTYIGNLAGSSDQHGELNTFIGAEAGKNTQGAFGGNNGCFNTFTGYRCGYENVIGYANDYYGKEAGHWNNGSWNCIFGAHSGDGFNNHTLYVADSNCFFGHFSVYNINYGNNNVIMGCNAAFNTGQSSGTASDFNVFIGGVSAQINPGGKYNFVLGYGADAYASTCATCPAGIIKNAGAIGAEAVVNTDNSIILGNNAQYVGIGMSNLYVPPTNRLEISYSALMSSTYSSVVAPTYSFTPVSPGTPTGASGLQFRDLTAESVPYANTNVDQPFLTVDNAGNVVLMTLGSGSIGTCAAPPTLISGSTNDPAINLLPSFSNSHNYWFEGNGAGSAVTNVYMGYTCPLVTGIPEAKLNVKQASTSNSTIGVYVENDDASGGSFLSPSPLIGVESFIPAPVTDKFYNVAGWFQANGVAPTMSSAGFNEYAIFVPGVAGDTLPLGGTVDIGYAFSLDQPDYMLDVNGLARIHGTVIPSDSNLKKNVEPFKYGLKAIRNLDPITYNYNGIGGFNQKDSHIGLIAQNLQRNVPNGVQQSKIIKDTVSRDTATILNVYEEAVMYTAVNAIKQLDSTVSSNRNNDSIKIIKQQQTIDSLRNEMQSIQTCLIQLCGDGHSRIHKTGGGGSGDTSTAVSNIQDVFLSASNTPLLYQNIPNPFSQNTKINYYLPEGTQGAYIVFYDNYGNQMKQVQLSQTGNGTLNITPENLTSGIYSYSLVVNNKVIDTKRMILQK